MSKRKSGVLLHITSLPSPHGIGDFGSGAYQFADFLKNSKQSYWQVLPLNPTDIALSNSPYSSCSAFAGNVLLISPEFLIRDGFLTQNDLKEVKFSGDRVDYVAVAMHKVDVLYRAFHNVKKTISSDKSFKSFYEKNKVWLDDYSLFVALKEKFEGASWCQWPENIRKREPAAMEAYREELHEFILREKFFQYLFYSQWFDLKGYCNKKGIKVIGDAPIYVQHDSADAWANKEIFKLDENGECEFLAGVPPDYFSETGQLWGNPVYRWDVLQSSGYDWWKKRLKYNFDCFDIVRIDHFRGFVDFWEIPKGEQTAINGKWAKVNVYNFFDELLDYFKEFPIIAEDLGIITADVKEVIKRYRFPGMKILQFAFDGKEDNPYLPQNHIKNCIVYTGTHDNNTTKGWFRREATEEAKVQINKIVGQEPTENNIALIFVKLAMNSIADTVILPLQDILGLDESARMNQPSTITSNWEWRVKASSLNSSVQKELANLCSANNR
ncbi:MAG: 4-alpha-glucanotransferase [Candidatus Omnitrophica bacterium]|nr:4-alpha-glucanotransferase [Candidatus Omnitrophota bacterium]